MKKKWTALLLATALLASGPGVLAAGGSASFSLSLSSGGSQSVTVKSGEEVKVDFALERTDSSYSWQMRNWQTEIAYDEEAFELVSVNPGAGVVSSTTERNGTAYVFFNDVSFSGKGDTYPAETNCSFTLKTLNKTGTSTIRCTNNIVCTMDSEEECSIVTKDLAVAIESSTGQSTDSNPEKGSSSAAEKENGSSSTATLPPANGSSAGSGSSTAAAASSGTAGAGSGTVSSSDTSLPFTDVKSDAWYYDAVSYVYENGIFAGYGNGSFGPEDTMTRSMFVTVLNSYCGKPGPKAEGAFSDVKGSAWYSSQINWAYENGIIAGIGDGLFAPERPITLQEMVQVLYSYSKGISGKDVPSEYGAVASWARDAMSWGKSAGLFDGIGGTLTAGGSASRAQIAQMMMNFNSCFGSGKQDNR